MAPLAGRAAFTRPWLGSRAHASSEGEGIKTLYPPPRPSHKRKGKPPDSKARLRRGGLCPSAPSAKPSRARESRTDFPSRGHFPGAERLGRLRWGGGGGRPPHLRQKLGPPSGAPGPQAQGEPGWKRGPGLAALSAGRRSRPARRRPARPSAGKERGAPPRDEGDRGRHGDGSLGEGALLSPSPPPR